MIRVFLFLLLALLTIHPAEAASKYRTEDGVYHVVHPNAAPFHGRGGTPEWRFEVAMQRFAAFGVPADAIAQVRERFQRRQGEHVVIPTTYSLNVMMTLTGEETNVQVDVPIAALRFTVKSASGSTWEFIDMDPCDNWSYHVRVSQPPCIPVCTTTHCPPTS